MTPDEKTALAFFLILLALFAGVALGNFYASFSIPSCKVWDSPRLYDHILIADDVVCTSWNEVNATYYRYDTLVFNGTEYIVQKVEVENTTAKSIIVCSGGRV